MEIKNCTSFVGFLVTLSTLSVPLPSSSTYTPESVNQPSQVAAEAGAIAQAPEPVSLENRLDRLGQMLRDRAQQLPNPENLSPDQKIAVGFANGRGRTWVDARRGGWNDGRGGSFVNRNNWRNGWGDGGGFANWRNN